MSDKQRTPFWTLFIPLVALAPFSANAGDGVDVSFSVQAVRLRDMIASRMSTKAEWSLAVNDLGTGKREIDEGSSRNNSLVPGSLIKLFVTAAILEQNAQEAIDIRTVIAVTGKISGGKLLGDIIIKGSGNPLLSGNDLLAGVEKIKALGIKEITGGVVVDDSLFDVKTWSSRYTGPAYGVPSALGLDLHTVAVVFEGNQVLVNPPNDAVKGSLNPSGKLSIRRIDDLTYEATGTGRNASSFHNRFSLADPALYAGGTFMTLLRKQGIPVKGGVKRGIQPAEAFQIVRLGAYDLKMLIRDTNQRSLNVAADNMLLLLGASRFGAPGTRKKGIQAVNDFLRDLKVPMHELIVDDGSGVSDRNGISARHMAAFLQAISKRPWFSAFYDSLSRPGLDGRLRDFGYTSGRFHVKTGQLREAFGLAGYADRQDGRKIAFAYIVNGQGSDMPAAASAAIEVMKLLEE